MTDVNYVLLILVASWPAWDNVTASSTPESKAVTE